MSQPDATLMYPNEMIKMWLRERSQQENPLDDPSLDEQSEKEFRKSELPSAHAVPSRSDRDQFHQSRPPFDAGGKPLD